MSDFNSDLETSNELAPTSVVIPEPIVAEAEHSADEIEGDPPIEEDSVIKVKKPRSQKQIESLKQAQIARTEKSKLRKAEKIVKAQNTIEDAKPKPPKHDIELVKELMSLIHPDSRPRVKDDSDSEDSIDRLQRRLDRKKASRAKKTTVPIIAPPAVNIVKTPKKKILSFS
tara:strand:- start:1202 stop:1714 length:513 start_codon:yes stop_codon:yes gene_type:complete